MHTIFSVTRRTLQTLTQKSIIKYDLLNSQLLYA